MPTRRRLLAWRNDWHGLGPPGSDLIGGVGYYRIQKPCQYLKQKYDVFEFGDIFTAQAKLKKVGQRWDFDDVVPSLIKDADIVLMKNISHPGGLAWFAGACDFYNKPLIVDMDDDYFSVDDLNPRREYFKENHLAQITHKELFKSATAMIVATEPLVKPYLEYNQNIHVIHNYNDTHDWHFERGKRSDGRIVIGWAGSQTHESDFHIIEPVIKAIWDKYGDKIVFSICGGMPPKLGDNLPKGSYEVRSGTRTMRDYHQRLASWGFDIGLAPLKDSAFNDGKSHGKWMEYAMYKIPTVASNFGPYKRVIKSGSTGLLAANTDEWIDKISLLIEREPYRQQIGQAAYTDVKANWQWADHWQEWDKVFEQYSTFRK